MRFHNEWLLLPQRVALHVPSAIAVLADLHLGYSAARQHQGDAVPARTVCEEMQPFLKAAAIHDIRQVVIAGDLFERGHDGYIERDFLDLLKQHKLGIIGLVPGNHDRGLQHAKTELPILVDGYDLVGWRIIHGDGHQPGPAGNVVMGHWHPAIRWNRRKVPCFLMRGRQLILPAFSMDAAGVDVRADSRWLDWDCAAIVGDRVIRATTTPGPRRTRPRV
jgi:metallophosphoesterase superfamily enzyme